MGSKFFKNCGVPLCDSTTIKTPNKLFISVPVDKNIRKKWLRTYTEAFTLRNSAAQKSEFVAKNIPSITALTFGKLLLFALYINNFVASRCHFLISSRYLLVPLF